MATEERSTMLDQHEREQDQSLTAQGWGKRIGLTGPNAFPWAFIFVLMGVVGYFIWFNLGSWGPPTDLSKAFADQRREMLEYRNVITEEHKAFREGMDESVYILSKCLNKDTQSECPNNINMPESLRRKLSRF